jgi:AcrR family transcriptional regulator
MAQEPVEKDPEARRIIERIVEAASRLYEKKGFYETSVAEIAEEAGISVPVTYHYVTRKSDIMLLIMEGFTDQFQVHVQPEIDAVDDPAEKLRRAIRVYYSLVDREMIKVVLVYRKSRMLDKEGLKKIMASETEAAQVFSGIIQQCIDNGTFRPCDTDLAAYNILVAGHAWALKNWHFKEKFTIDEYIQVQTDFIMRSLQN